MEQGEGNIKTGRRFGFVGILVANSEASGLEIQRILGDSRDIIQGRMGLPHLENDSLSVITLIVCASPAELGGMTGRLGRLKGVTVKSGLAPESSESGPKSPGLTSDTES